MEKLKFEKRKDFNNDKELLKKDLNVQKIELVQEEKSDPLKNPENAHFYFINKK